MLSKPLIVFGVGISLYIIIRFILLRLHNSLEEQGLNNKGVPIRKKKYNFSTDPVFKR